MAELPYQTFERVTGKKWTPQTRTEAYQEYGITEPAGSVEANVALQNALISSSKKSVDTVDSPELSGGAAGRYLDTTPEEETGRASVESKAGAEGVLRTIGSDTTLIPSKELSELRSRANIPEGYYRSETGEILPVKPPKGYYRTETGEIVPMPTKREIYAPETKQNIITRTTSSVPSGGIGVETDAEKSAREYLDTFEAPKTEAQIAEERTTKAKNTISALDDYYASLLEAKKPGEELARREANARAVLSGLVGSTEAGTIAREAESKIETGRRQILAEKALKLATIYNDIQTNARDEAKQLREAATKKAENILERKEKARTKASDNVKTLAKSGFDFGAIRDNDPETYKHLAESVGGEEMLNAIATINRPHEDIIDKRVQNGSYVIAYKNPITGEVRIESVDLGLPGNYTEVQDLGDKKMFYPKGRPQDAIFMEKGLAPKTYAPEKAPAGTPKGMTSAVISAARARLDQSKNEGPEADGVYANPKLYQDAYNDWISKGGTRDSFVKNFPPEQFVNPENTWLPSFLMPKSKTEKKSTTTKSKAAENPYE